MKPFSRRERSRVTSSRDGDFEHVSKHARLLLSSAYSLNLISHERSTPLNLHILSALLDAKSSFFDELGARLTP